MYALVDARSFYVSCERVFDPKLRQKPMVVLSNNDGMAIALCARAKTELGIQRGTPYFQLRPLEDAGRLWVRSSNYELYGDMSARMHSLLDQFAPQESYSIDESFLDLTGLGDAAALKQLGQQIRSKINQCLGLEVGVGAGPTLTLAKAGQWAAKQFPSCEGVAILSQAHQWQWLLQRMPVAEIWGVGRRLAERLQRLQIKNAWQLCQADGQWLRQHFGLPLYQCQQELCGIERLPFAQSQHQQRHQLIVSRSFGRPVGLREELHSALCAHLEQGCVRLRKQKLAASVALAYFRSPTSNPHRFSRTLTLPLMRPGNDPALWQPLLQAQMEQQLPHPKLPVPLGKCGVIFTELSEQQVLQGDLFCPEYSPKRAAFLATQDRINRLYGRDSLHSARLDLKASWQMRRDKLSPAYTTRWAQVPLMRS